MNRRGFWTYKLWDKGDLTQVGGFLGILLAVSYFCRSSVLTLLNLVPDYYWVAFNYGALLLCCAWIGVTQSRLRPFVLVPMLATCVGIYNASMPKESLVKWIAWCTLAAAVGPLFKGAQAQVTRQAAWRVTRLFLIAVGVLSAAWFFLGWPVVGKGRFTGVTIHSNVSGPLAGMAVLLSIVATLRTRSWWWAIVAAVCLVPCIASGSRAGVLALALSLVVVGLIRFGLNHAAFYAALVAVAGYFAMDRELLPLGRLDTLTAYLREKGLQNTRQHLWEARLEEFKQHPFIGIGVGMAEGAGIAFMDDKKFNVEPGSSYLAVLSMTGLVGGLGLAYALSRIGLTASRAFDRFSVEDRTELLGMISFLAVHAMAEGWILAVGSPFTFLFWLTCGRTMDLAEVENQQPQEEPISEPSARQQRLEARRSRRRQHPAMRRPSATNGDGLLA